MAGGEAIVVNNCMMYPGYAVGFIIGALLVDKNDARMVAVP